MGSLNYNNGIWLAIEKDHHEKAELLARKLYDLDIPSKQTWFDELRVGLARQPSKIKTLDEFFSTKRNTTLFRLNIGRTEMWQGKDSPRIFFVCNLLTTELKADQFYWFNCGLEDGYKEFDKTFKEIYGLCWAAYPRL